jgi:RsmE family RNA methyltransferase
MYFYLPTSNISQIDDVYTEHFFSMRVKPGDILPTTDLRGLFREIEIIEADKKSKSIKFKTLNSNNIPKAESQNILFQAITDKIYLEKLVEIAPHANIDTIYLFHSDRSPVGNINTDRLERILYRSCEQAQKMYKPSIEVIDHTSLIEKIDFFKPIVLALSDDEESGTVPALPLENTTKSILVGPEGGWSTAENCLFAEKQLIFESLGEVIYPAWLAGYSWFIRKLKT